MNEGLRPEKETGPDQNRRAFLKNALRVGTAAAVGLQAPKLAVEVEKLSGSERMEQTFEQHPALPLKHVGDSSFIFFGAGHTIENVKGRYSEICEAIRSCDLVLVEYGHYKGWSDKVLDLVALDEEKFKAAVMSADKKKFDWFEFVGLIAARMGKPVMATDPEALPGSVFEGFKLTKIDEATQLAEYTTLAAAVAGVTASELTKEETRRDVLTKMLAIPALATYGATKAIGLDISGRITEASYAPKNLQQTPFGKTIIEISHVNYRDFGSVSGLYALARMKPEYFKQKTIGAFYGNAHFPITQILQIPKEIVDAKLAFYRKLDPSLEKKTATLLLFDSDYERPLGGKGDWRTIAEAKY